MTPEQILADRKFIVECGCLGNFSHIGTERWSAVLDALKIQIETANLLLEQLHARDAEVGRLRTALQNVYGALGGKVSNMSLWEEVHEALSPGETK